MKFNKNLVWVLIVIIIIIVFGVYFERGRNEAPQQYIQESSKLKTETNSIFSISYPKGWRFENHGSYFQIFSYPENNSYNPGAPVPSNELKVEAYYYTNIQAASLDAWINARPPENIVKTENLKMDNGDVAKEITNQARSETASNFITVTSVYYLKGNKGVVFIKWPSNSKYSQEFENIIRSFSFAK